MLHLKRDSHFSNITNHGLTGELKLCQTGEEGIRVDLGDQTGYAILNIAHCEAELFPSMLESGSGLILTVDCFEIDVASEGVL